MVEGAFFVPASLLKTLRREFWEWAAQRLRPENLRPELAEALYRFYRDSRALPGGGSSCSGRGADDPARIHA